MLPEQLAIEIANWAKAHRMTGSYDLSPSYNESVINETFRGAGLRNATSILQDRKISYIGVNDENNSVVIYLEKTLRVKDTKALINVAFDGTRIEFRHSSLAQSGNSPPPPPIPAYHVSSSGKYTCGSSVYIGNHRGAGTLGCLLQDKQGNKFGLSNNHVLADNNYADLGLPIGVPGLLDVVSGGIDPVSVGHLHKAVPLMDGSASIVPCKNNIDAAIFSLSPSGANYLSSSQRNYYDTPTSVLSPKANMKVQKVGRTTGMTSGRITSRFASPVAVCGKVAHTGSDKLIYFNNVWGIEEDNGNAFSLSGDSGSIITNLGDDGTRHVVGLLFAGSAELTFMVDIQTVLTAFDMEILSNFNV